MTDEKRISRLQEEAVNWLKQLIAIPSFSREEMGTAEILSDILSTRGITVMRTRNNIWARNIHFDPSLPTLLLNSHHDTVKPNKAYTLDPFLPLEKDGKLYGLGSNDAGGCLVSLLATFLFYHDKKLSHHNIIFAASAEEEISGNDGIELLIPEIGGIAGAIVGEPTQMQMAIAERGLMVLDCIAYGKAGHAAREEGENALYKALDDIEWFRNYRFEKDSNWLGPVKMSVTIIEAGSQHNVVPDQCKFTVDIRVNEHYSHEEVLDTIRQHVSCEAIPRSSRLRSTSIAEEHPLVKAGLQLGKTCYGSPTTSDKALMPFPALKMGPGDSARSHTADEYIFVDEIHQGIRDYIAMLKQIV